MSGQTPLLSVVVPVRNRRDLLRRCLEALADQAWPAAEGGYEIVVVDDGSTDGTALEAEAAAARGWPVRLVRGPGQGAVSARATGVGSGRAPLLAFTDSDCVPGPGWLAAGAAALRAGAALAYGPVHPQRPPRLFERSLAAGEEGLFPTANVFYRREALEAAGGFPTDLGRRLGFRPGRALAGTGFGEDTVLAWRVIRAGGSCRYLPDAVVEHHVFAPDGAEALRRAWSVGAFPALVAEVPELRHRLLRRGLFLGSAIRVPLYAAATLGMAGRRRLAALALAGWAAAAYVELRQTEPSRRLRVRGLPAFLGREAVSATALVLGSIRAREPVL